MSRSLLLFVISSATIRHLMGNIVNISTEADKDYFERLYCNPDEECSVNCELYRGCDDLTIYGPIDHPLMVKCDSQIGYDAEQSDSIGLSCRELVIHAEYASNFTLYSNENQQELRSMSLYTPISTEVNQMTSYLQLGPDVYEVNLYTFRGKEEINFKYDGEGDIRLFCGANRREFECEVYNFNYMYDAASETCSQSACGINSTFMKNFETSHYYLNGEDGSHSYSGKNITYWDYLMLNDYMNTTDVSNHSWINGLFYCPSDAPQCVIWCTDSNGCDGKEIWAAANRSMYILCSTSNGYGCSGLTVHAEYASHLVVRIANEIQEAEGMVIYAPVHGNYILDPDTNHWYSAYIICGHYSAEFQLHMANTELVCAEMTIHARNGWDDVLMVYYNDSEHAIYEGRDESHNTNYMYCGESSSYCRGFIIKEDKSVECDQNVWGGCDQQEDDTDSAYDIFSTLNLGLFFVVTIVF